MPSGWFWLNFPINYLRFLHIFYDVEQARSEEVDDIERLFKFLKEHGNKDETSIANLLAELSN